MNPIRDVRNNFEEDLIEIVFDDEILQIKPKDALFLAECLIEKCLNVDEIKL